MARINAIDLQEKIEKTIGGYTDLERGEMITLVRKSVECAECAEYIEDKEHTEYAKIIDEFFDYVLDIAPEMVRYLPKKVNEKRLEQGYISLPDNIYFLLFSCLNTYNVFLTKEQKNKVGILFPKILTYNKPVETTKVVDKIMNFLGYTLHDDYHEEYKKYKKAIEAIGAIEG